MILPARLKLGVHRNRRTRLSPHVQERPLAGGKDRQRHKTENWFTRGWNICFDLNVLNTFD